VASVVRTLLRPVRLLAPLNGSDRITPAIGDFYFWASSGSVTLPASRYNYSSDWTPLLAGLTPAGTAASFAAPTLATGCLARASRAGLSPAGLHQLWLAPSKKLIYAMSLDTDRPTNRAMVVGCAVSATRNYLKLHVPRTLNPLLCNAHAKTRKLWKRSAGFPPLEAIPRRSIHQPSVAAQTLHVASYSRRAYHRERRRH